jgi:prepilin-type N-terminal cleavage/methylation domain-containing protein
MNFPVAPRERHSKRGFTLVEIVIVMAIALLIVAALVVFANSTGRVLVSVTSQSTHNQTAGNGIEFMIARIRQANTASVDVAGTTLNLGFDDNPEADSNGDQIKWNDRDHWEQFQFVDSDNQLATLEDNTIAYRTNTALGTPRTMVPANTRKLPGLPIFSLANNSTVFIRFGLLTTNSTPFSQAIEIRTQATLRNRTQ